MAAFVDLKIQLRTPFADCLGCDDSTGYEDICPACHPRKLPRAQNDEPAVKPITGPKRRKGAQLGQKVSKRNASKARAMDTKAKKAALQVKIQQDHTKSHGRHKRKRKTTDKRKSLHSQNEAEEKKTKRRRRKPKSKRPDHSAGKQVLSKVHVTLHACYQIDVECRSFSLPTRLLRHGCDDELGRQRRCVEKRGAIVHICFVLKLYLYHYSA